MPSASPIVAKTLAKSALKRVGVDRNTVASGRMCIERNVPALRPGRPEDRSPRILCYHSVGTPSWGVNDVTPAHFRRQLEFALMSGRSFVPASRIAAGEGKPGDLALTFDDGLASVARNAAPILKDLGIPWTMFVVADWAEGLGNWGDRMLSWHDLEGLAGDGAILASHSVTHANFGFLTPGQMDQELGESRDRLDKALGIRTTEFAIPFGLRRDWPAAARQAAARAGYATVYAQAERRRAPGTVARTFIGRWDNDRVFRAAINGAYDRWEEFR